MINGIILLDQMFNLFRNNSLVKIDTYEIFFGQSFHPLHVVPSADCTLTYSLELHDLIIRR